MEQALAEYFSPENDLAVAAVAAKHEVPRMTLVDRIAGVSPRNRGHEGQQYLPAAQESALAKHVLKLLRGSFAPSVAMVKYLAIDLHDSLYPDNRRVVGTHWVSRFVGRHSEFSLAWNKSIRVK